MSQPQYSELVCLHGHIIDSLILAKVLDTILMMGGSFDLQEVRIGVSREQPSRARILVQAPSEGLLAEILTAIQPHGAAPEADRDCEVEPAPADGVLPDRFYATSHLPTEVRLQGHWVPVDPIEMDTAIRVDPVKRSAGIVKNPLDEIGGIGPARKRALLDRFGSARGVSRAALAELETVDGVNKELAKRIYDFFHDKR